MKSEISENTWFSELDQEKRRRNRGAIQRDVQNFVQNFAQMAVSLETSSKHEHRSAVFMTLMMFMCGRCLERNSHFDKVLKEVLNILLDRLLDHTSVFLGQVVRTKSRTLETWFSEVDPAKPNCNREAAQDDVQNLVQHFVKIAVELEKSATHAHHKCRIDGISVMWIQ